MFKPSKLELRSDPKLTQTSSRVLLLTLSKTHIFSAVINSLTGRIEAFINAHVRQLILQLTTWFTILFLAGY